MHRAAGGERVIEAYLRGDATEADLRELEALLKKGGDEAKRAASQLSDGAMIAGWFRAEADAHFVAEAMAAARTESHDPAFVGRTLERIRRRPLRRERGPVWILPVAAAVLFAVLAAVLFRPVPARKAAPEVVAQPAPVESPRPEERAAVPPPEPVTDLPAPEPPRTVPVEPPLPPVAPAPPVERPPATRAAPAVVAVLVEGDKILEGQDLETPARGRAVFRFMDGTRVEVGPGASLKRIADRAFHVAQGSVEIQAAKQPADRPMVVTTPHAQARVLGTRFTLTVGAESTRVDVAEGCVRLARGGAAVEVAAGFGAVAGPGPEPSLRSERSVSLSFQEGAAPAKGWSGAHDAHIGEFREEAEREFGGAATVWVDGNFRNVGDDRFGLLRWDLSAIPPGSVVLSASLSIHVMNNPAGKPYGVYELKRDWVEGQVTWNSASAKRPWQEPGAKGPKDRAASPVSILRVGSNGPFTADLGLAGAALVQTWVDRPAANHGVLLGDSANGDALGFVSRESPAVAQRPKLTVVFVPRGR